MKEIKKRTRFAIYKMYHPFLKETCFMIYRQFLQNGEVTSYRMEVAGDTLYAAIKIVFDMERFPEDFGDFIPDDYNVVIKQENGIDYEVGHFSNGNEALEMILRMES